MTQWSLSIYHPKFSELEQLIISYDFCSWLCGYFCIHAGWEGRDSLEIRLGPQLEIFTGYLGVLGGVDPSTGYLGCFILWWQCSTMKHFKVTLPECKHLSHNNTLLVSHLTNILLDKASHMANSRVIAERLFYH